MLFKENEAGTTRKIAKEFSYLIDGEKVSLGPKLVCQTEPSRKVRCVWFYVWKTLWLG